MKLCLLALQYISCSSTGFRENQLGLTRPEANIELSSNAEHNSKWNNNGILSPECTTFYQINWYSSSKQSNSFGYFIMYDQIWSRSITSINQEETKTRGPPSDPHHSDKLDINCSYRPTSERVCDDSCNQIILYYWWLICASIRNCLIAGPTNNVSSIIHQTGTIFCSRVIPAPKQQKLLAGKCVRDRH